MLTVIVAVVLTVAAILGALAVLNVRGGRRHDADVPHVHFLAGDRPPPEVEADLVAMLTVMRDTGADDAFAVRHGAHLVIFVNENAARCSCGWSIIALTEDLDAAVRAHVDPEVDA